MSKDESSQVAEWLRLWELNHPTEPTPDILRVADADQIEDLANAIALQAEAIRTRNTHGADIHAVSKLLLNNVQMLVAWTRPLD